LFDLALAHDGDPVTQGDRLRLVVGDIDGGDGKAAQQTLDLNARGDAKFRVQVGEGLVEQEEARIAHDAAPDGHTLLLAAGEGARLAVEQVVKADAHDLRGDADALHHLLGRALAHPEKERQVALPPHVGVEGIALEDHANAAVLGADIVHHPIIKVHQSLIHALEAGHDPQQGALATARRADDGHGLAVTDGQREVVQGADRPFRAPYCDLSGSDALDESLVLIPTIGRTRPSA